MNKIGTAATAFLAAALWHLYWNNISTCIGTIYGNPEAVAILHHGVSH